MYSPDHRGFDYTWLIQLEKTLFSGQKVRPRGKLTLELPQQTMIIDLKNPVLTIAERKLNYRFMLAEAAWMIRGNDDLAYLTQFNPNMAYFSDDGLSLKGAYGPRIIDQVAYVIETLITDPESRQAVLTTWVPNPEPSKDIPCTVAMTFNIRNFKLNCHVFMRSNDLWLGTPYDVFSFSMITIWICKLLNVRLALANNAMIEPGSLFLTAASSHLYETHFEAAKSVVAAWDPKSRTAGLVPSGFWQPDTDLALILDRLAHSSKKGDGSRWWEHADRD